MIFHVSTRPLRVGNNLISPKESLKYAFGSLCITFNCLTQGTSEDGRWLYEIECDDQVTKDVILEGLQAWACHEKTMEKAKELAETQTGVVWNIIDSRLIPDAPPIPY